MDANWRQLKEEVNNFLDENVECSTFEIGNYHKHVIWTDIKHIVFSLSRYKFVSKLAAYKSDLKVLELGCSEALGAILFQQNTDLKEYVGIDFDEEAMDWNKRFLPQEFKFIISDIFDMKEIKKNYYNMIVSLDVIEHIEKSRENEFLSVIQNNLSNDGFAVIGTPNKNMMPHASEGSRVSHINMYDQDRLYRLASQYFHNVFIFNMNDEIVNTGFAPMSCYIFAVCCSKK